MQTELWLQLEPIVDTALDLPAGERPAYLDEACAGNAELRREVERLIVDCEASDGFLEDVVATVDAARTEALADDSRSWIGHRFGVYRAVEPLGSGGMGTVLHAERDDGLFEQSVAVKVVEGRLGAAGRARFAYERQILADLEHPHIGRLLDGGVTDDGLPYLVMERVEGVPLDTFVEQRHVDPDETIRLLSRIARAVDHAHRSRVVHLDLKPSNILVTETGEPKLLDFGIAEMLDPERHSAVERPAERLAGSSRMTPAYAAPEQLRGDRLTSACDIYALGVLLYRLLSGALPFDPADADPAVFVRRVSEAPPPPLSRSGAAVGRDVEAIVTRALAKTPEARYPSAAALADDLDRALAFKPVAAMPPRIGYWLRCHIRRHPRSWLAGALAVVTMIGLGFGWAVEQRRGEQRIALAQEFAGEAERIEGFLRYAHALPEHDIRREAALTRERMRRIERQMAELGPIADGPGHVALGRGWASLGEADRAVEALEYAWSVGERGPATAFALGRALTERYGEARSAALRLRDPTLRADAVERAAHRYRQRALDALSRAEATEFGAPDLLAGFVALVDDRLDDAVEHARAATSVMPWSPEGARLEGEALGRRGQEAAAAGDWTVAEADFAASLEALGRAARLAPSDPGIATEACAVERARIEMGRLRKQAQEALHPDAVAACDRALRIDPDQVEAGLHRAFLHIYRMQDPAIDLASRHDHAERAAARLAEIGARVDEPAVDQALGTFHLSRAVLLVRPQGGDPRADLDAAIGALRRAVESDPGRVDAHVNLGTALAIAADEEAVRGGDAESLYSAASARFQQALDRVGDHLAVRHNLSTLLYREAIFQLHRGADARPLLRRSLAACEATLEINPSLPAALNHRAAVLEELARAAATETGDPEPAFEAAREALGAVLDAHPDYLLPWVNTASLEVNWARWQLASGVDPRPALERAGVALDRAEALGGAADELFHVNRAELGLMRAARRAVIRDDDPAVELETTVRAVEAGLEVTPNSQLLRLVLAHAAALAGQLDLATPGIDTGRAAVDQIVAVRPDFVAAHVVAAELAWLDGDRDAFRDHLDRVPRGASIDPEVRRRWRAADPALSSSLPPDRASGAPEP